MSTANELRQLKSDELLARAAELEQQLFELRAKHSAGILDSTAELKDRRRQIARCLTVRREQELGLSRLAKEPVKPAGAAEKAPAEKAAKKAEKPAKKAAKKE